ncbi:LrgA family protein [Fusobacterium nucleatum subsp. nucleatum ATCC 23726]|nr:LrgA family protein [Fusobacterium nucleatum subsp. nucleatum ATCC 23726]
MEDDMINEFMLIFVINYVGILISSILHFPLPGTITALLLLFLLLQLKVLKLEKIENAANFLLLNMTLFFMPPTVKIIDSYHLLEKDLFKIIVIIVVSTFITMGITGKVVQVMIDYREKKGLK